MALAWNSPVPSVSSSSRMRPEGVLVPRRSVFSDSSATNKRPFSSKAIATGEVTEGLSATNSRRKPCLTRKVVSAFVVGADAARSHAFDAAFDSAAQPGREKQKKTADRKSAQALRLAL